MNYKIFFFIGLFFILTGCAVKQEVVYKEVKVPVQCDVVLPQRPKITQDTVSNTVELISYSKSLEELLKVCVK